MDAPSLLPPSLSLELLLLTITGPGFNISGEPKPTSTKLFNTAICPWNTPHTRSLIATSELSRAESTSSGREETEESVVDSDSE
ncbi:hypothetical protein AmFV_115 [Apis mellifera filamentous virus]|uniref:hypothetical protein n=1 Tax=Apis mellifera filamentous virus TaxID=1100043 RepID=UPI0006BE11DA|nr:hypothetical protein APL35_gp115 [Apis mellifera filamentous virus]AKY03184.1 hypothetical protein [Apis mellifera filamentous virus]UQL06600.1 hypothetical protein AmFV_115 [Apis mellifera filamentous virus]